MAADDPDIRELASGLQFPEGPVAMADGSVVVVEIGRGTITRVADDGDTQVVAEVGDAPNGAAIGPDGALYLCNNGGFAWSEVSGMRIPIDLETGTNEPPGFEGGSIQRVDLDSGAVETLYEGCDGRRFRGPNDLVFDAEGGMWFTDFGKFRRWDMDRGGIYYAQPDGSSVVEAADGIIGPNGIGLSPDGDRVYVAETHTGRLLAWDVEAPGRVADGGRTVVAATPGHLDSLAVEAGGNVVVAALPDGLAVFPPDGGEVSYVPMPDPMCTNVCFRGEGLRKAVVTLSISGRLVEIDWPRPGLELTYP